MKRQLSLMVGLCLGASLIFAQGKEFWHNKDYRQWTEREVKKLLEESPWSQSRIFTQVTIAPLQNQDATTREREANPQVKYQASFRSAAPIRQAMVRQQMLTQKYDKMTPEQQQEFDAKMQKFLTGGNTELITINVDYSSNVQGQDRDLAKYWQTQTAATLKNSVFLNITGGKRIPLQNYVAAMGAGRSFQIVFPHQLEGKPLFSAADKSVQLEFIHPAISGQSEARVLLNFKPEQMTINGTSVY